jgi:hypothetical protein
LGWKNNTQIGGVIITISIFIYTRDNHYAEIITHEVMEKLGIVDKLKCTIEPYWKFEDMVISVVELDNNFFLKDERLKLIAEKWERYPQFIITSNTIIDNIIKISDVAMIDIWMTN